MGSLRGFRTTPAQRDDLEAYTAFVLWKRAGGAITATTEASVASVHEECVRRFPFASPPLVAKALDALADGGYVERTRNDKRPSRFRMTEQTRVRAQRFLGGAAPAQGAAPEAAPEPAEPAEPPDRLQSLADDILELLCSRGEARELQRRLDAVSQENVRLSVENAAQAVTITRLTEKVGRLSKGQPSVQRVEGVPPNVQHKLRSLRGQVATIMGSYTRGDIHTLRAIEALQVDWQVVIGGLQAIDLVTGK